MQDFESLEIALSDDVFKNYTLVKHCYEFLPFSLSSVLLKVSCKFGYKHIFLYRMNQFERLISLEVARTTNVWGKHSSKKLYPKLISGDITLPAVDLIQFEKEHKTSMAKTKQIINLFEAYNIQPFYVDYNSCYKANATVKFRTWNSLFNFLGFSYEVQRSARPDLFDQKVNQNSQNTHLIYQLIPNWEDLKVKSSLYNNEWQELLDSSIPTKINYN